MALTRRGKRVIAAGAVVAMVVAVAVGAAVLTNANPIHVLGGNFHNDPPATCPLTGRTLPAGRKTPARPLLAVKVENTPDAYPLAGLDRADIVYEEVVEGGITRFVALFHCQETDRVGPVRSARTTDPKILLQFQAHPLLGYSGGAPLVVHNVDRSGIVGLTESSASAAFTRDSARVIPHNLFASTLELVKEGTKSVRDEGPPRGVFTYDEAVPAAGKRIKSVLVDFPLVAADWRWQGGRWVRYLEDSPMLLENGRPVTATNVVIQRVKTTEGTVIDAAGFHSPEVEMTGGGRAWILRNGRVVAGRWVRDADGDVTTFVTKDGSAIPLAPGTTWVELAPTGMFDAAVTFTK